MDNKTKELSIDELEIIANYTLNGKLHPDFLPITTYDMIQMGYPYPTQGVMVARDWGGTDEQDRLLPAKGMWCRVEDIEYLLKKHGLSLNSL